MNDFKTNFVDPLLAASQYDPLIYIVTLAWMAEDEPALRDILTKAVEKKLANYQKLLGATSIRTDTPQTPKTKDEG